jgi:hypothetical protein
MKNLRPWGDGEYVVAVAVPNLFLSNRQACFYWDLNHSRK